MKNPKNLQTGEELYDYLQGKTEEEIRNYFLSRGAKIRDGIMLNNGLNMLYRIEKEKRERENTQNEIVSSYDGEETSI